jgi:hypothetical protein
MKTVEQQPQQQLQRQNQPRQQEGFRFEELLTQQEKKDLLRKAFSSDVITLNLKERRITGVDFISKYNPKRHKAIYIIFKDRRTGKVGLCVANFSGRWEIAK